MWERIRRFIPWRRKRQPSEAQYEAVTGIVDRCKRMGFRHETNAFDRVDIFDDEGGGVVSILVDRDGEWHTAEGPVEDRGEFCERVIEAVRRTRGEP